MATKEQYSFGCWHSDAFVAYACVKNINWVERAGELAYLVSQPYEGKGLVTEAVKAVTQFSFRQLKINRLYLRVIPGNEKSVAVAERCGYQWEKTAEKEFELAGGEQTDVEYYRRLKET